MSVVRKHADTAIDPIYPKPNLSKRVKQAQVVPYLLRNVMIDRPVFFVKHFSLKKASKFPV